MKTLLKKIGLALATMAAVLMPVFATSQPVMADSQPVMADCVDTNLFGKCEEGGGVTVDDKGSGIMKLLGLVVNILLYGIGVVAVIGVVVAGIMYLTARDNEAQATKAKTRLVEVAIGLIAWAALFALLQWLIPGFTMNDIEQVTGSASDSALVIQC